MPGIPDEMLDAQGRLRPCWAPLIDHIEGLGPRGFPAAIARGEQYLREAGVFFRTFGTTPDTARDWPFSAVPIVLPQRDWAGIAAGLIERADLLEAVIADLYGPARLVSDGLLPAALVAENPEWLRPMVGVAPRGGHYLHFVAFEIGRGPDGRWWVLGDRTQSPSGAGFALENRVAATRVFAEIYGQANVRRLAGFFRAFRDALNGLQGEAAARSGARAGILSAGPMTDTYYEQAYIARYLGLPLLEGGDLSVEDGAVMIRTVSGPVPVEVLWRRMDAHWADPLELDEASRIGTPGLMSALRAGGVTLVNALGAGVVEAQAMLAFLPGIAQALNGRPLRLPNIATWWCGQTPERDHVRAHARSMSISPALSPRLPFETDDTGLAERLRGSDADLDAWIVQSGAALVGQEVVRLSTTPAWQDGMLAARPMSIRVFLARTPQGWQVMPGGFARIGRSADTTALSLRQGSAVADVWIVADRPVGDETMLPAAPVTRARAGTGELPSRAADNLFWLGRYVERTEGLLRLSRALNARIADGGDAALRAKLADLLVSFGAAPSEPLPQAIPAALQAGVGAASRIRDRFSVDGWTALTDLEKSVSRMAAKVTAGTDAALGAGILLRKVAGFSGLVQDNMYRATGWRFLVLGRALERAATMAALLARLTDPAAPTGALDAALEIGDSTMIHRQRFAVMASRESVVDLLAFDPDNPRAIRFQLDAMAAQVARLPQPHQAQAPFAEALAATSARLQAHSPASLDPVALRALRADVLGLSDLMSDAYLR